RAAGMLVRHEKNQVFSVHSLSPQCSRSALGQASGFLVLFARASPSKASAILKMIKTAEIAARIGLRSKNMPSSIFLGRVVVSTLLRNIAITTSSKETTKAKIAPAAMPRQINGMVTSHSEAIGEAPRLSDA